MGYALRVSAKQSWIAAAVLLATSLVELSGPGGQRIFVSPSQIISVRQPRSDQHFAPGTRCLVGTTDGKYLTVVEPCDEVRQKLQ
jgi:hypothetical protein